MHPPKHGSCPTDLEDSDLVFCFNSFGTIRIDRKVYQAHQIVQCLAKSITVRSGCGVTQKIGSAMVISQTRGYKSTYRVVTFTECIL